MTAGAYAQLEERWARIAHLEGALGVLHWDRATMMPDGGAAARADQLATLGRLVHELETDPALSDLLDAAEAGSAALDPWQAANLREMRRLWRHANAVPAALVEALSRAASRAEMTWRRAREEDDFAALAPELEVLLARVREQADAKAEAFGCDRYEALLDAFDPGRSVREIERLFGELESFLPELLEAVLGRQAERPAPRRPAGPFAEAAQRAVAERFMAVLGFDFHHGRLDVSHHPFTGGVPDDVRITTRTVADDFTQGLMAVIHETGHAQYERGLPPRWRGQPVGRSRGMTIHESQSLLMEMQVCRSREFIAWAAPILREAFAGDGAAANAPESPNSPDSPEWETDNLVRLVHRVERGLVRVYADEVTYPLHVILRFGLERALVAGELAVADLPGAWNEGMQRLLGVAPATDAEGCLQDIHWPSGAFGYFPTYTLGALAAAQLFAAARRADSAIAPALARGDFGPLRAWLAEHVHGLGCRLSADALIEAATGAPLGTAAFREHLRARYLEG